MFDFFMEKGGVRAVRPAHFMRRLLAILWSDTSWVQKNGYAG